MIVYKKKYPLILTIKFAISPFTVIGDQSKFNILKLFTILSVMLLEVNHTVSGYIYLAAATQFVGTGRTFDSFKF